MYFVTIFIYSRVSQSNLQFVGEFFSKICSDSPESTFYGLIDRVPFKFSDVTVIHVTLVEYGRYLPYDNWALAAPKKRQGNITGLRNQKVVNAVSESDEHTEPVTSIELNSDTESDIPAQELTISEDPRITY